MRLLIIVRRAEKKHRFQYVFPLGLGYISAALKKAGYSVDCLDLNHREGDVGEVTRAYLNERAPYDFILSGGLSVDYQSIRSIIDGVRSSAHRTKIILGGALVSTESEIVFDSLRPDYIILGEGEETIVEFMQACEEGRPLNDVAGIGFRANGRLKLTKPRPLIHDIDSIQWPDLDSLNFNQYLAATHPDDQCYTGSDNEPRVYGILGARSCPYLCTFCFHTLGNAYRQRSVDSILRELEARVRLYRINTIVVYDDLFSTNHERIYEFCKRMKLFLSQLPWACRWFCELRVDSVNDELLATMKDSGCYMITYGLESYHPDVLKSMRKGITPQQIDFAIRATVRNKIALNAAFILGDSAETTSTARTTIAAWKTYSYSGIQLNYIIPYSGSRLYQHCVECGIIKDRLDYIAHGQESLMNMTDSMSDRAFKNLQFEVRLVNILYRSYGVVRRLKRTEDQTFSFEARCPQCRNVSSYSNFLDPLNLWGFGVLCQSCNIRFIPITRKSWIKNDIYRMMAAIIPRYFLIELVHLKRWFESKFSYPQLKQS